MVKLGELKPWVSTLVFLLLVLQITFPFSLDDEGTQGNWKFSYFQFVAFIINKISDWPIWVEDNGVENGETEKIFASIFVEVIKEHDIIGIREVFFADFLQLFEFEIDFDLGIEWIVVVVADGAHAVGVEA